MAMEKVASAVAGAKEVELLKDLILNNSEAWGLKQSDAQMSHLTPIEVTLQDGHSILRKDSYHQPPEVEKIPELKFEVLKQAAIVEKSANPIWSIRYSLFPKSWLFLKNEMILLLYKKGS
eukprot:snap_masked-scaffold_27-processed-gene-4.35-mRNA-1 protein AED:1.00 eAED:1.00 QI:0/-1/0/0/-1/1/1/0/119